MAAEKKNKIKKKKEKKKKKSLGSRAAAVRSCDLIERSPNTCSPAVSSLSFPLY